MGLQDFVAARPGKRLSATATLTATNLVVWVYGAIHLAGVFG